MIPDPRVLFAHAAGRAALVLLGYVVVVTILLSACSPGPERLVGVPAGMAFAPGAKACAVLEDDLVIVEWVTEIDRWVLVEACPEGCTEPRDAECLP